MSTILENYYGVNLLFTSTSSYGYTISGMWDLQVFVCLIHMWDLQVNFCNEIVIKFEKETYQPQKDQSGKTMSSVSSSSQ